MKPERNDTTIYLQFQDRIELVRNTGGDFLLFWKVLDGLEIDIHGVIHSPGRHEGNMYYTPCFEALDDSGELFNEGWDLTKEDKITFPFLPPQARKLKLWKDNSGFIYSNH